MATSTNSSSFINNLLSPGAIAGIAIGITITTTILALLCWCCCCRHSSKRSRERHLSISRLQSDPSMSELGLVHQPASMPEMGTTGQRVLLKEPPPAYYTLEHRNPPVEMHAESSHRMLPEIRSEMEAWNGFQMVSDMSPGMNSRTMLHEAPVARPVTERSTNLQVNTDVNPVIHTTDENIEEDEEEGLSRSITYSSFSLREAALGMVAMPSIVSRERKRDQGKS